MKHGLVTVFAALLLGLLVLNLLWPGVEPQDDPLATVEGRLAEQGCMLARLSTELPGGAAVVRYALPDPRPAAGFYLKNPERKRAFLFQQINADSPPPGEFCIYPSEIVRNPADGSAAGKIAPRKGWELFEIVAPGKEPSAKKRVVHEFEAADGFMRKTFGGDDGWRVIAGNWQLNKHGGGLPADDLQKTNPGFQRATNPFSLVGWGQQGRSAVLLYDTPVSHGDSYLAEASFYLGSPGRPLDTAARRQPIPTFLIAQGELDGPQAGFGWWADGPGAVSRWSLCFRESAGPWVVMKSWPQRPPRCNWARAGIAIAHGHTAVAMLDGREFGRSALSAMVGGSFHVHTGRDGRKIELDDVSARPFSCRGDDYGQLVYEKSFTFAEKSVYGRSRDPVEFDNWAKAANAFIQASGVDRALDLTGRRATVRMPLYGDFTYKSTPELANGKYRFLVLSKSVARVAADKVTEFHFTKSERGWSVDWPPAAAEFALEFGRRSGRFLMKRANEWQPLGVSYAGPAHLMIVPPHKFNPEQHRIYSKCTWNELFEHSPVGWYWYDGMFGMNTRWACQPNWNFMAGQSPALAAFFSSAAYFGDQEIDCFMSLKGVLPGARQYYIRRDLCVSFCTNGRDLDSGYTLLFGSERNARTVLLKRGKEIASTTAPKFLFPKGTGHHEVHWLWWNFDIKKAGDRIVVKFNNEKMFDVADPDPISGGHVAFWSIGNGFVVSRVNVAAERRANRRQRAFAEWPGQEYVWKPLYPDAVLTRKTERGIEVCNLAGGGTFAVRTHTRADLSSTPVLELPMLLDPDAKVNLHVEIDGRPWIVRISSPLRKMEYLLTPSADKAFRFGRPVIGGAHLNAIFLGDAIPHEGVLRFDLGGALKRKNAATQGLKQITLTIGNSSNAGYLLAGFWGNHSGSTYCVGDPKWAAAGQ